MIDKSIMQQLKNIADYLINVLIYYFLIHEQLLSYLQGLHFFILVFQLLHKFFIPFAANQTKNTESLLNTTQK